MKVFGAAFLLAVLAAQTLCVNATIIRRQTGSCSDQHMNSFICNSPPGMPGEKWSGNDTSQDAINNFTVDVLETICARDCYGVLTDYIEQLLVLTGHNVHVGMLLLLFT